MGLVIAMAVIGGIESLPGAVVGAAIVYALSELLREYGEWRFVLLGLALIVVQRFAQNGLFPMVERYLDGHVASSDKSQVDIENAPKMEGEYVKPS
jgi:branched-chain amino acid transport system permease protein